MTESGSIRSATFTLNKLLRDNVSLVSSRVYPPGLMVGAQLPRIIVHSPTPNEQYATLGAGLPAWKNYTFRVDIFSRKPQECDSIAGQVEDAVANNRFYNPSTIDIEDHRGVKSTESPRGYFVFQRMSGGSETTLVPALQNYHRTMFISSKWLQTS